MKDHVFSICDPIKKSPVKDVSANKAERFPSPQLSHIVDSSRREIVEAGDGVAVTCQMFAQVAANEARATSNQRVQSQTTKQPVFGFRL
jgi:hypothetical protein